MSALFGHNITIYTYNDKPRCREKKTNFFYHYKVTNKWINCISAENNRLKVYSKSLVLNFRICQQKDF